MPFERVPIVPWAPGSTGICKYLLPSMGPPPWLSSKEATCNAGDARDMGSIPGSRRSSGGKHDNHSSILAWRIPRMEEPGGLQSTRSQSQTQMKWLSTHTLPSPGRLKFHFYSREPQSSVSFLEKRQALICPRHNLLPCWLQNQVENPSPSS